MPTINTFIIALFIAFAPLIASTPAQAQDSCGQTLDAERIGEPEEFCNIYERQLAYREGRIEFRKQIDERRKDYIAPQTEAIKKHKQDLEALNGKRNHDNDITGF